MIFSSSVSLKVGGGNIATMLRPLTNAKSDREISRPTYVNHLIKKTKTLMCYRHYPPKKDIKELFISS